jgi:16S rRNA (cytosine1402-N4)-methyltransferase
MEEEESRYHVPVMLQECMDGLAIKPAGIYVDVTFGGGGHSAEILRRMGDGGRLFGFDQDADAEANIPNDPRFTFVRGNFRYLYNFARYYEMNGKVDGLLADLGVSWHDFDEKERGFSFRFDGALDMRMNARSGKTAADVVNTLSVDALADLLRLYGEVKNARSVATAIVKARDKSPLETTAQLADVLQPFCGRDKEKKFLAQVFQALRIEVNDELQALREMLEQTLEVLKPGGRLVVMTYHSLEDRLVKNFMKSGNIEGHLEKDFYGNLQSPIRMIGKVTVPSDEEMVHNPRSRSAKLRIAEKI